MLQPSQCLTIRIVTYNDIGIVTEIAQARKLISYAAENKG